jgi:hypothetical protein
MNRDLTSSFWVRFKSNFSAAPLELNVFLIFSFVATVISLTIEIFCSRAFNLSIFPITGWSIHMPYIVTFYLMFNSMVRTSKPWSTKIEAPYNNILFLLLYVGINVVSMLTWDGDDNGNPYLIRSPWRPIWTIALPVFWAIILLSPRIKKYYES